jgi:UDP-glucose 4-epimerase
MILVTGGAGFIGAHATLALIEAGHDVTVLDSLVNGHPEAIARIGRIAGRSPRLVIGDVRDRVLVERLLRGGCEAVLHFAGLKAVGTSVADPARYYDANVAGACALIGAMRSCGVHRLIFSSSATVYGVPQILPMAETHPLDPVNPYGRSKQMVEAMLGDLAASDPDWRIVALRYFNPVGAHESGLIGEDPEGPPDNLLPYVVQTAVGRHPHVRVFGNDYPTPDGTGIRDYIHVCDLAAGHLRALERLAPGFSVLNLGRGAGASVLEVISTVTAASGRAVPWRLHPRRPGDVAELVADPGLALRHLGWRAERNLADACRDAWRWQRDNPEGYGLRTVARCAS